MITIRGNNLYPAALEDVIREFDGIAEFRIELRTVKAMQHVKIEIEPFPALGTSDVDALVAQIAETIKSRWHFQAEVVPVASGSLPRFEMKGRRFVRLQYRLQPDRMTPKNPRIHLPPIGDLALSRRAEPGTAIPPQRILLGASETRLFIQISVRFRHCGGLRYDDFFYRTALFPRS